MAAAGEEDHCTNDSKNVYKIIIIGAGIAGFSAANHLVKKGEKNVLILEARNRVGGRIISIPMGNGYVELGACWIHGVLGNPVYELALANRLLHVMRDQEPHTVVATTEDGKRVPISIVEEIYSAYFWFCKRCEEYYLLHFHPPPHVGNSVGKHLNIDISAYLDQFQNEDRKIRQMIFNHLLVRETCITGCNSMNETGLSDFGSYTELPGGNMTLPNGYSSLLDVLTDKLPEDSILTQHAVKCVRWNRKKKGGLENRTPLPEADFDYNCVGNNLNTYLNKVEVECENGKKFFAEHIIVTIPLGVLKNNADEMFDPLLPDYKKECMKNLHFGTVDKIYLEYDRPFLNPDISEVLTLWDQTDEDDISKLWFRKIYSFSRVAENILLAFVSGIEAEYLENLTSDEVGETCTNILRKFLNDPYVPKPCRVVCTSWKKQPYTQGSYTSIGTTGSQRDIELLGTPIYADPYHSKPVLLFAGEATHPSFYSTTHGAYLSGLKAAELLLDPETEPTLSSWSSSQPQCSVGDLSSWLKGIDLT